MGKIIGYLVGVGLTWVCYAFFWASIGPILFVPCPLYTPTGALVLAFWHCLMMEYKQWYNDQRYVLQK